MTGRAGIGFGRGVSVDVGVRSHAAQLVVAAEAVVAGHANKDIGDIKKATHIEDAKRSLLFKQPLRYSEDIDLLQTQAEPIGATVDAIRNALSSLGNCKREQAARGQGVREGVKGSEYLTLAWPD